MAVACVFFAPCPCVYTGTRGWSINYQQCGTSPKVDSMKLEIVKDRDPFQNCFSEETKTFLRDIAHQWQATKNYSLSRSNVLFLVRKAVSISWRWHLTTLHSYASSRRIEWTLEVNLSPKICKYCYLCFLFLFLRSSQRKWKMTDIAKLSTAISECKHVLQKGVLDEFKNDYGQSLICVNASFYPSSIKSPNPLDLSTITAKSSWNTM